MNQKENLKQIQETLNIHPHHNIGEFTLESEQSGNYKIISKEYDAQTLEEYLQGRINYWPTISEIYNIIIQVIEACVHLEQLNITHRNLNMKSILIQQLRENIVIVKIVDFSSAIIGSFSLSQIVNEPPFQAPKIVEQEKYNSKCDIYSLGIILYQLCFKELNTEELISQKLGCQQNRFAFKDRILNMLMEKMLVRDPIQRFGWNDLKKLEALKPQLIILKNRYLIDKKGPVGKGYQGVLYKTYDLQNLEITYCTKINNQKESFYNEISISALIQQQSLNKKCKNIIQFFEIFKQNHTEYIIMEYCELNLDQYFEEKNYLMTEEEILNLLSSVINGYTHLKGLGIIHRDIKPSNILLKEVDDKIVWKLIDFGCGKLLNQDLTYTNLGSELFKAPEIIENYPYNYQCDIFSLGVVLHYLVFEGQHYFGQQKDDFSLRSYQLSLRDKPFQCQKPYKKFSNNLLHVIDKMLLYNSEERIDWNSLSQEVNLIQNQITNEFQKQFEKDVQINNLDDHEPKEPQNQDKSVWSDNSQSHILFEKGKNLYLENNFQEAIMVLDQSLNLNKNDTQALFFKADSLRMLGCYNEAIEYIDKILQTHQNDVNALLCKADCLKMINNFEDSIYWTDKVLSIDPNHINSLFCKGDCLKRKGLFDSAIYYINKALLINSEHLNSMWCKGEILKLNHQYQEAIIWVDKVLLHDNAHVNSLQCKEQALKIDSQHVNSFWCKAECLRMLKEYQEAIIWSDKALFNDQNHLSSLRCKAESLKMLSKYEEAITWADKALSINSYHINSLYFFEGQHYFGQQKDDFSLRSYQLSLRDKPFQCQKPYKKFSNNLLHVIDKMLLYNSEERIDWNSLSQEVNLIQNQITNEFQKQFEKDVQINNLDDHEPKEPQNQDKSVWSDNSQSHILFEKGKFIKQFRQKFIFGEQFLRGYNADSLRMLGCYNEAIEYIDKILQTHQNDVNALLCKADCLKMINNFEDSIYWTDKVLSIDPNHINSLFCKGDCLKRKGLFDSAIYYINKALLINSEHLNSMWCKGEILKLNHQYQEAIIWVDKVLLHDNAHVNSLQCKEQALKIDSQHVNSFWCKAECLRMLKEYQEAIIWSDKALFNDQNHLSSLRCKAESLKMLSKYEEAITWADKALSINSYHINSLYCKADSLRMLSKYQEAIEYSDRVLSINPNHINALLCKADSLRMLYQYKGAIICLDKILQIDSYHLISLFCKGESLRMLKQYNEALSQYYLILSIDSNHKQSLASIGHSNLQFLRSMPIRLNEFKWRIRRLQQGHFN
ncbi:unnamed protein product [Paramecium octaurelia]|uniref:Protein kinase domain-containing protein n=1 Tax=Paramecium octaurelia TaxID=43137 RepID=A0A8S1SAG8_PAROT|nr:unnamed protein product [Paramecium octaurelia]